MGFFSKRIKAPKIRTTEEFQDALQAGTPVFVDFMKDGCQPCQVMDGIVNELAEEFDGQARVVKANLAEVPDLFQKFKVRSTPTFVLITPQGSGLHQRFRHSGLVKKDQLVAQIENAIQASH